MNGMSDRVSRMLIQVDFLRAMSHAIGTPTIRSMAETRIAMVKEFWMAVSARET